jgi:hypothetical protein
MTFANRLPDRTARGPEKGRGTRAKLLGGLAGRYEELRKRLADMLGRGDRDYSRMTALSQEIGEIRLKIRRKLERRRRGRKGATLERRPV